MDQQPVTIVESERTEAGMFGSLEVPVEHNMTVETRRGAPLVIRFLFGYSVVAVTGGQALDDVVAPVDDTFSKYAASDGRWTSDEPPRVDIEDGQLRRFQREFTWTNGYLEMVSVVACVSDDQSSMIVHGSCPTNVGDAELVALRGAVASARLP